MNRLDLDNGKYTVINELNEGGKFKALRYGEEWRSLAGDNLVLHMFYKIEELTEALQKINNKTMSHYLSTDDMLRDFKRIAYEALNNNE